MFKMTSVVYGLAGLGGEEESKLYQEKVLEGTGERRDSLAEEAERALLGKTKEDEQRERDEAEKERLQRYWN